MLLNARWTTRVASVMCAVMWLGAAAAQPVRADDYAAAPKSSNIHFGHDVVFTMSVSSDSLTNQRIAVTLANRLRQNGLQNAGAPVRNAWIVPQGTWGIGDYVQQCAMDPKTRGAFIVMPAAITNASENYIALLRSWTNVSFSVIVAECLHPDPVQAVAPAPGVSPVPAPSRSPGSTAVVWVSDLPASGKAGRSQVEFFPLAVLTSMYLAFAPQRTYQTTTISAFPTPNPLPASGARSSVQTLQSNVLNSGGTGSLQSGVLTAFSSNTALGVSIGAQSSIDAQALRAADDAIGHLLSEQLDPYCMKRRQASLAPGPPAEPESYAFCTW